MYNLQQRRSSKVSFTQILPEPYLDNPQTDIYFDNDDTEF